MTVTKCGDKFPNASHDRHGVLRKDLVDLNDIIDNIDGVGGRNDAIRAYLYALRDLQAVNDAFGFSGSLADVRNAKAKVAEAFGRLIIAELTLNQIGDGYLHEVEAAYQAPSDTKKRRRARA